MVKKTLTVEQYIKELILTLITTEQTKLSKYWTEEGVSVYKTYPITELKMHWLIHWHLC